MKRRVFIGLGAASIGTGALINTGAFSTLNAGRGIAVNAAEDPGGLLGITGNENPSELTEFTNNTDEAKDLSMNISLTSDDDDDIEFDIEPDDDDVDFEESVDFDIGPGDTQDVDITGEPEETADVTIDVAISNGDDNVGSITLNRPFKIPQSAAIDKVDGSPTGTGQGSGKFGFQLENTSSSRIYIDAIRIIRTDTDAIGVAGGDILVLADEGDEQIITENLEVAEEADEEVGFTEFSPNDAFDEDEDNEVPDNAIPLLPFEEDDDNAVALDFDIVTERFDNPARGGVTPSEMDIEVRALDGSVGDVNLIDED